MTDRRWRRAIGASPLAPVATFPLRVRSVARYDARVLAQSAHWLVTSREHHNHTYDLTARNREHLAWFVASVTGATTGQVRGWLDEIEQDSALPAHVRAAVTASDRRGLADRTVRYGRRVGWYALIRAVKPRHVVESGVDKGLGSCVIASALLRNAADGSPGRLTGLDINPASGYLVSGRYAEVFDLVLDDSLASIPRLSEPVDVFLHDSNHSAEHEAAEFRLIEDRLAPGALLLSDNATQTDELLQHAEKTGRQFMFFQEVPDRHWFPGDGIGIAWRPEALQG